MCDKLKHRCLLYSVGITSWLGITSGKGILHQPWVALMRSLIPSLLFQANKSA